MTRLRGSSDGYPDVVDTSHAVRLRVDVWRGGELVATDVPVLDGELVENGDQEVPEAVRLTVPAYDPATSTSWRPVDPLDPLNNYGQQLRLTYIVDRGAGAVETVALGYFPVVEWQASGDVVDVTAAGRAQVLKDARLLAPTSPPAGATFTTELRRLVEGFLPVAVDAGLVDRPVPGAMAWGDDRLGALYELADAWPAELYVDELGVLRAVPPGDDLDATVELLESGGTVVELADSSGERAPNIVVARGEDASTPDRPPVVAYAVDDDPTSASYYGTGAEPYGVVTAYFTSPLLTAYDSALAAARTVLARRRRRARSVPVVTYPDARLRAGVRVDLRRASGELVRTRVSSSRLPLTAGAGAQRLELGEL